MTQRVSKPTDDELQKMEKADKIELAAKLYYQKLFESGQTKYKKVAEMMDITPRTLRNWKSEPEWYDAMKDLGVDDIHELIPKAVQALSRNLEKDGHVANDAADKVLSVSGILSDDLNIRAEMEPIQITPAVMSDSEDEKLDGEIEELPEPSADDSEHMDLGEDDG